MECRLTAQVANAAWSSRFTLFPWLTVKQNVMFGLRMNDTNKHEAEKQAREWLDLIGLDEFETPTRTSCQGE